MKGIGMKKVSVFCAAAVVAATMLQGCFVTQHHTQEFAAGDNNLQGKQLVFIPTPGANSYQRQVNDVTALDRTTSTTANTSGGAVEVALGANSIEFYGEQVASIFIGGNGTIGMGEAGDNSTLENHFMHKQVSLLPVDADSATGTVTYGVAAGDAVAVTYDGVTAGGEAATAQAEFFIDGTEGADPAYGSIALTYTAISTNAAGVVGLSKGYTADEITSILSNFGLEAPLTTEVMTGT